MRLSGGSIGNLGNKSSVRSLCLSTWKSLGALVVLSVCVGACVPTVKAPEWRVPMNLDGERYYVPIPPGFVEQCSDKPPLRTSAGGDESSSRVVACLSSVEAGSTGNDGTVSVVPAGESAVAHFEAFRTEVERQLKAGNSNAGIALSHAGRVLRRLSKGKDWVVYAAVRRVEGPSASGSLQPGSLTVVLAHEHIFYLALWNKRSLAAEDWKAAAAAGRSWAQSLIRANLWR